MKGGLHSRISCTRRSTGGFTIVEVLIVFAVTGLLFLSAAILIGGRQNREEFNIGIQQLQSQVQSIINEISSGYYPSTADFDCQRSGTGIAISPGNKQQGTNSDCIFLGKVIQFGSGVAGSGDPEKIAVHSLAGLRTDADGSEILIFQNASPTVIPNSLIETSLGGGLSTHSMSYNRGARPISAVAIVSSLGQATSSGILTGSQKLNIIPIDGTVLTDNTTIVAGKINSFLKSASVTVNPAEGVQVCFASGGTNQSGLLNIGSSGSSGRELEVVMDVKSGRNC